MTTRTTKLCLAAALVVTTFFAAGCSVTAAQLAAIQAESASLRESIEDTDAKLDAAEAEGGILEAAVESVRAELDQMELTAEQRAEAEAELAAREADFRAKLAEIRELAGERERFVVMAGRVDDIIQSATTPDEFTATVLRAAGVTAGGLFPQFAVPISATVSLISAAAAAAADRRRRQLAAGVRAIDASKGITDDGTVTLDTEKLAELQDAAGVRKVVNRARRKA